MQVGQGGGGLRARSLRGCREREGPEARREWLPILMTLLRLGLWTSHGCIWLDFSFVKFMLSLRCFVLHHKGAPPLSWTSLRRWLCIAILKRA
jgi:hypothetical protein